MENEYSEEGQAVGHIGLRPPSWRAQPDDSTLTISSNLNHCPAAPLWSISRALSTVKLAAFWRGGYSLNVIFPAWYPFNSFSLSSETPAAAEPPGQKPLTASRSWPQFPMLRLDHFCFE